MRSLIFGGLLVAAALLLVPAVSMADECPAGGCGVAGLRPVRAARFVLQDVRPVRRAVRFVAERRPLRRGAGWLIGRLCCG